MPDQTPWRCIGKPIQASHIYIYIMQANFGRALRCSFPMLLLYEGVLIQWNPKYGCKGTVTTRFALIALVAWQY